MVELRKSLPRMLHVDANPTGRDGKEHGGRCIDKRRSIQAIGFHLHSLVDTKNLCIESKNKDEFTTSIQVGLANFSGNRRYLSDLGEFAANRSCTPGSPHSVSKHCANTR
jgi:hypothetical protein